MKIGNFLHYFLAKSSLCCLERFPALFTHKGENTAIISALIVGYKKPLELRHMALRDDQQTAAFGNQIVVGKDHRSAFIAVIENLRFHAV